MNPEDTIAPAAPVNPLLPWRDAAKQYGLPQAWLLRQLKDGAIPSVKIGGTFHVSTGGMNRALRQLAGEQLQNA